MNWKEFGRKNFKVPSLKLPSLTAIAVTSQLSIIIFCVEK
jgi:hypothetical protein